MLKNRSARSWEQAPQKVLQGRGFPSRCTLLAPCRPAGACRSSPPAPAPHAAALITPAGCRCAAACWAAAGLPWCAPGTRHSTGQRGWHGAVSAVQPAGIPAMGMHTAVVGRVVGRVGAMGASPAPPTPSARRQEPAQRGRSGLGPKQPMHTSHPASGSALRTLHAGRLAPAAALARQGAAQRAGQTVRALRTCRKSGKEAASSLSPSSRPISDSASGTTSAALRGGGRQRRGQHARTEQRRRAYGEGKGAGGAAIVRFTAAHVA